MERYEAKFLQGKLVIFLQMLCGKYGGCSCECEWSSWYWYWGIVRKDR